MIASYDWPGGREAMLRFGPETGPVVVMALPLFEEANRTRAFAVAILRALADHGIAGALPDLPGTGESTFPLEKLTILRMQEAYAHAAAAISSEGRSVYAAGIRTGALFDSLGLMFGRWHFAPQSGAELMRELKRIKQAEFGDAAPLDDYWYFDGTLSEGIEDPPVEIAGNLVSPDLLTDLAIKTPFDVECAPEIALRTVRLESDARDADAKYPGSPLWRRAEPGNDPALAALLAEDIADWVRACEG